MPLGVEVIWNQAAANWLATPVEGAEIASFDLTASASWRIIQIMKSESTVNVTEAQANLPRLIRRDSFAISRHGKVVGVFLSKDRIEALIETMELLGDENFTAALREYKSGKTKFYDVDALDKEMSA